MDQKENGVKGKWSDEEDEEAARRNKHGKSRNYVPDVSTSPEHEHSTTNCASPMQQRKS